MTLEEFGEILKKTKLPVTFEAFPEGSAPQLPYICYLNPEDNNFAADGVVYFAAKLVHVELYTKKRNLEIEKTVEAVLSPFFYEKTVTYIEDEKCYQILYELEV